MATKFYRHGGAEGTVGVQNGIGIQYYYKMNGNIRAIRFNYIQGEIKSLTMWKKYEMGEIGDFTVDLGDLNLTQAASKILEILKAQKPEKDYSFYVESADMISGGFLTEAKRVSPADFYGMVTDALFTGENIAAMSWERLSAIAIKNDVQIPGAVRDLGIKGSKLRDLTKLLNDKDANKVSTDNLVKYHITVTPQDTLTKKFLSPKGDQNVQDILKKIQDGINEPDVKTLLRDPNTLFSNMKSLVKVVCRRNRNSLVITGGAGVGKSFTVFEAIAEEGLVKGQDWFLVKGKITTASLYQMLYMHRNGKLLVFDDTDSVVGSTIVNTSWGNMSIEDLYNCIEKTGYVGVINGKHLDQIVLKPVFEELSALGFSENGVEYGNVNYIMKHDINKKMYRITSGENSVEVTEDHSVMVIRDEKLIEVKPKDITSADKLVILEK